MSHLGRRSPASLDAMRKVGRSPRAHPMAWAMGLIAAAIAFGATWSALGRVDNQLAAPSNEIIGTWGTEHPRYADRGFTIDLERIEFEVGENGVQTYPIRSVTREVTAEGTSFVLVYPTNDGVLELAFVLDEAGQVRMGNLDDVVWTRR